MKPAYKLVLISSIFFLIFGLIIQKGLSVLESETGFEKLFSGKHNSMIIGTSKAEKLSSQLFNKAFLSKNKNYDSIYNYAFNLASSPYGPDYYKKILSNIDESSGKSSVFVLCIDPWSVSSKKGCEEDSTLFSEHQTYISFDLEQSFAKTKFFFEFYTQSYFNLFIAAQNEKTKDKRPGMEFVKKHLDAKMSAYRKNNFANGKVSNLRYTYFEKLIQELKKHGEVVLVKLPVSKEMIVLEKEYAPNFEAKVIATAQKYTVELIDFYPIADQFLCPDGNHLFWEDANKVSVILGRELSKNLK